MNDQFLLTVIRWHDFVLLEESLVGPDANHLDVKALSVHRLASFILNLDGIVRSTHRPSHAVSLLELLLQLSGGSEVVEDLLERGLSNGILTYFKSSLVLFN